MCFNSSCRKSEDLSAYYLPDGTINEDDSYGSVVIPDGIPEHIDNSDTNSENGILGFLYETGDETFILFTSPEAEEYCDPFNDEVNVNPFSDSEYETEQNPLEASPLENLHQTDLYQNPFSHNEIDNSYGLMDVLPCYPNPDEKTTEFEDYYFDCEPLDEDLEDDSLNDRDLSHSELSD